jgi:PDZ domain
LEPQQGKKAFLTKFIFISLMGAGLATLPSFTFAAEPGTLGVAVNQLYSDQQSTRRGALIIRHVDPHSAAADAGIQAGDLILAADGKRVFNTELNELMKRLDGPAGSSVELSVVQVDGNSKQVALVRRPYAPHRNPQTDVFSYAIPGNWQKDPRYNFPLPWSPGLAFKGFEDLYFAPGFDDLDSTEYHSYVFLWWLDGKQQITAAELQADMVTYFKGLAEQRGRNNKFSPDLSQIRAQYASSSNGSSTFGTAAAANFSGTVTLYDRRGKVMSLYSEVSSSYYGDSHTGVFFGMSKEPRPAALWLQIDAIRNGFRYR